METQEVKVFYEDKVYNSIFYFDIIDSTKNLICLTLEMNGKVYSTTQNDYFTALSDIRNQLGDDYKIAINGARFDFYPSNMSLQMSLGKVGYLIEMEKTATVKLRTFDDCFNYELLDSVNNQEKYFKEWSESMQD